MKRNILLALFGMFISGAVFAQFSLRPQVGINFPTLTEDIAEGKWKGNVGYQFGADVQIGGTIYVQPGLNFQSVSLTVEDVGDLDVQRINIPVMVGFRLFEGEDSKAFGLRGFAGPNFAINVSEDVSDAFGDITKDNIKDSQISALVGAGADLSIFFIDVAYKFGLTKMFEDINNDANKHIFFVNAGIRLGF
jgi:hypothetical protein